MNWLIGLFGHCFITVVQALPLRVVAWIGRHGGAVAWYIDSRHRRIALENLERVFSKEFDAAKRREIAHENFRRLGENYLCGIKTAGMPQQEMSRHLEFIGYKEALEFTGKPLIIAVGHFGNFELFSRSQAEAPTHQVGTTYRALKPPALDRLLLRLRERSGLKFFERRTQARELKRFLGSGQVVLGILGDQHAGDRGLWLPFLGVPCSCSSAPALFALRYDGALCSAICYRVGLAQWRIEMGPKIPTAHTDGTPRSPEEITLDINAAYEAGIRKDPANWFWVHRRWKPASALQKNRLGLSQSSGGGGSESATDNDSD